MRTKTRLLLISVLGVGLLAGCAGVQKPAPAAEAHPLYHATPNGTIIYAGEFEFVPPPPQWRLFTATSPGQGGEKEFSFGFLRIQPGPGFSQSAFVYDEEPFGYSRNLETRAKEYFKRFLWASTVRFHAEEWQKVKVLGGEGLAVTGEGKDLVRGQKVRAKVIFAKRGERVVSFYITQWRPIDGKFDLSAFATFDAFVKSFHYLKKSFYQTL